MKCFARVSVFISLYSPPVLLRLYPVAKPRDLRLSADTDNQGDGASGSQVTVQSAQKMRDPGIQLSRSKVKSVLSLMKHYVSPTL
jgi:hypothetical protein